MTVYEVGVVGRQVPVCRGDATLPATWSTDGLPGLTIEMFEVAQGIHAQGKDADADSKLCGELTLSLIVVEEPGAQFTGFSSPQICARSLVPLNSIHTPCIS